MNNAAGPTLQSFYDHIKTHPHLLQRTATVQPAIDFLAHLNQFSDIDLFTVPLRHVKTQIQTAMFNELTDYWTQADSCKNLHLIHNDWQPRKFSDKSLSRVTTSCYHTFACGHGYLRAWSHRIERSSSPNCRHGCGIPETSEHILLECPFTTLRVNLSVNYVNQYLNVSNKHFLPKSVYSLMLKSLYDPSLTMIYIVDIL